VVTVLLVVLGVAFAVVAALYLVQTAGQLPSFFPGHQAGSGHHHIKHGLLVAALALVAAIGAWMSAGRRGGQ
jgi:hypothetical protein